MTSEHSQPDPDPDADLTVTPMSPAMVRALAAHPTEMARLVENLRGRVRDERSLLTLMQRVAAEAVRLIDDVHWAGVTAQFAESPFTTAHTHARVLIVDEGQYGEGDGPCLRALRTGRTVSMTHSEVLAIWPQLARVAESAGVVAFHAEPLHARERSVGALNLYSARPDGLRAPDPDVLTVLTEYLGRGLSAYSALQLGEAQAVRLRAALRDRELIGQAIGVLMALEDISAAQARLRLQGMASAQRVDLAVVALDLIDGHTRS